MPDTDFSVDRFLRAIGKGPEQKREWWYREQLLSGSDDGWSFSSRWHEGDYLVDTETCPFADILTDWTPEKDALLLGVGLEWWRENQTDEIDGAVYKIGFGSNMFWESELLRDPKPGERLARAIWDAMKGSGQ